MELYCDTEKCSGVFSFDRGNYNINLKETTNEKGVEVVDGLAEILLKQNPDSVFKCEAEKLDTEFDKESENAKLNRNELWAKAKLIEGFDMIYKETTKEDLIRVLEG